MIEKMKGDVVICFQISIFEPLETTFLTDTTRGFAL